MFCTKCGKEVPNNYAICPGCGNSLTAPASPTPPQQPVQTINSGLVPAILVTIFCCLPFGIVAIVYAAKVSGLVAAGNIAEAEKAAKTAKTWSLIGVICGLVGGLLYYILVFLAVAAQN